MQQSYSKKFIAPIRTNVSTILRSFCLLSTSQFAIFQELSSSSRAQASSSPTSIWRESRPPTSGSFLWVIPPPYYTELLINALQNTISYPFSTLAVKFTGFGLRLRNRPFPPTAFWSPERFEMFLPKFRPRSLQGYSISLACFTIE